MALPKDFSLKTIASNWQFILLMIAFFASVTFFVSALIPPKYESDAEILILQKNMDVDAYRAAKSSEFAGEVLKKIIGSSDFMNGVLASIGKTPQIFGVNPEDQIKNWNKAVAVNTYINTGIIKITVLDESQKENQQIMEGLLAELQNNGLRYHGNDNITLKKIGGPIYHNQPSFPIIWLNILIAIFSAIFFSIGVLLLSGEKFKIWFTYPQKYSTEIPGKINIFSAQEKRPVLPEENYFVAPEEDYFASFSPKAAPPENLPTAAKKDEIETADIFPEEKEYIFPEATSEEVKARLNKLLGGKL